MTCTGLHQCCGHFRELATDTKSSQKRHTCIHQDCVHTSFSYMVMGELGGTHSCWYLLPCLVLYSSPLSWEEVAVKEEWEDVWREGWGEHSMSACVCVHDQN